MNFARLNHILIPPTAEERERWRRGRVVRMMTPLVWFYFALSEEGRVLSVLTLFVGSAAVDVGRTQVHLLWAALVGLLAGALGVRRWFAMPGLRLDVAAPARVTAGEAMTVELVLENRGDERHRNVRIRRPFLPWDGAWMGAPPVVAEVEPRGAARVRTAVRFVQRGAHHLDPFLACQVVPLGLSVGPHLESETCRIMVLPRAASIQRLTLACRPRHPRGGRRRSVLAGETADLAGVRPYRPGDPVRTLHARTWARTGQPHVREYQREEQIRIGVLLYAGERAKREETFEAAVSVATGLVTAGARGDVVVELAVFGQTLRTASVGRGVAPVERALDVLAAVSEDREGKSFEELVRWIGARTSTLSGLYVVSAVASRRLSEVAASAAARGLPTRSVWVLERRALKQAPAEGRALCADEVRQGARLEL